MSERQHSREKYPILRLEVLGADGTRANEHVVFCRLQHQSVRVEECCRCVRCDAITDDEEPVVECTIPVAPCDHTTDPEGERTEVGSLLCHGTVVVAESVPLRRALDVLRHDHRHSVAIVDARHVMVGLVHDSGFPHLRRGTELEVKATMSSVVAIDERTPVRTALRLLAVNHLREATVVSRRGVPIGVFRDVDGLHWIGTARHGNAPDE